MKRVGERVGRRGGTEQISLCGCFRNFSHGAVGWLEYWNPWRTVQPYTKHNLFREEFFIRLARAATSARKRVVQSSAACCMRQYHFASRFRGSTTCQQPQVIFFVSARRLNDDGWKVEQDLLLLLCAFFEVSGSLFYSFRRGLSKIS